MMFKKFVAGILGVMLLAMQPVQLTFAEEVQVQDGDLNNEEKTAEQLAAEAEAKLEAERKEALETPSETDQLENWPAGPAVYAHSAIVMDMNSGAILYSKKAEERHFPASITKLLTTLVALENAELTDKVTFSQASVDILNWDDAHIGMRPGEEISMKDALRAVLLASANEVSYAVAESTGITHLNGGYDTFIELMNTRAKELGCTNSHWVNPNGLHDEEHYTTAHDMALIASAVYQQEEFRNIMDILEYRIPPTNLVDEERVFQQNHKMLWPENAYYYEYCTGGKTGYTDQSGTTLVTMADNGELQLAAVVLQDYGVDAYTDTKAMMEYVFNNFTKVPLDELGVTDTMDEIKSFTDENAYAVLPKNLDTVDKEKIKCEIKEDTKQDGTAVYTYEGQIIGKTKVSLKTNTNEKSVVRDEESKESKEETVKSTKKVIIAVAAVVLLIVVIAAALFYRKYLRYKKWQEKQKRMRRRRAAESRKRRKGSYSQFDKPKKR